MCFSPEASFIASGGLIAAGAASLKIATPKEKAIALIPLFFGIQQFFEGIQWLHLNRSSSSLSAAYAFLFFAFILWPVYIPAVLFKIESERRRILRWFVAGGMLVSGLYLAGFLMHPLVPKVVNKCIQYEFTVPFATVAAALYLIVVFGSLFASSKPFFRFVGVTIVVLAAITDAFYYFAFASVWCFFAAATSSLFFWYLWKHRKTPIDNGRK